MTRPARFFIAILISLPLFAHQGYGITTDEKGAVYFTDNVNKVIWKLVPGGAPEALITDVQAHRMQFDGEGNLYYDHEYLDRGQWFTSLLKRTPEGDTSEVIAPVFNRRLFDGSVWYRDEDGSVYFFFERPPRTHVLLHRTNPQVYLEVAGSGYGHSDGVGPTARFSGVQAMIRGDDQRFYITDGDALRSINDEGIVTTIARGLTIENAPEMPYKTGNPRVINGLFGLAKDGAVFYVAYYGNRTLYRIDEHGKKDTFYQTAWPWSPTGVTVHEGTVYVLEDGRSEGNDDASGPRVSKLDEKGAAEVLVTIGE